MKKIIASDYKGKWFVLEDADRQEDFSYERPEINVEYVMGAGLSEHVQNCRYYGIPAYIGDNKELNEKIAAIDKEIDRVEDLTAPTK